jgi:O-antigen ligase
MKKAEKIFKRSKYNLYLLCFLVSISFPSTYSFLIPLILGVISYQIYGVYTNKLNKIHLLEDYWYILIFSLVFFRSVHTIILLVILIFALTNKERPPTNQPNFSFRLERYILFFFVLVVIDNFFHGNFFRGLDTYLYLLMYPVLFISLKKINFSISLNKTINIYLTSVFISIIYLIILNILYGEDLTKTNNYFAEFLDLSHVYYGMFLGLACSLLVYLKTIESYYISSTTDIVLYLILFLLIIYIGARISLIAVLSVTFLAIYNISKLIWYKKATIMVLVIGLIFFSFKFIPRFKQGLDSIATVYLSVVNNKVDDIRSNSWENMNQRYLVIDYSIKELKNNFVFGIGVQNVKDVISNKIIADGNLYFEPINTHNQYLHFFLGMGILGFIYFIFLLFTFLYKVPEGIYFLMFFLIIMMTESILVRVKGISLFFIFYLIYSYNYKFD